MPDRTPEWSASLDPTAGMAAHPSMQRHPTDVLRDRLAAARLQRLDDARLVGASPARGSDGQALLAADDRTIAALELAIAWREAS